MVAPPVPRARRVCDGARAAIRTANRPCVPEPSHACRRARVARTQTINKAQGQTLQRVGVYLPEPCFSHGQLYVAASRVGLRERIRFALPRDPETSTFRTRNVVYREALTR